MSAGMLDCQLIMSCSAGVSWVPSAVQETATNTMTKEEGHANHSGKDGLLAASLGMTLWNSMKEPGQPAVAAMVCQLVSSTL